MSTLHGLFFLLGGAWLMAASESHLLLELGPESTRKAKVPLEVDRIYDTGRSTYVTMTEVAEALSQTQLLLVGESHTSMFFHRVQFQLIRALVQSGRPVIIGLEMFPYTSQPVLDEWNAKQLDEAGFLKKSQWYEHWGYHWHYYREIFLYAQTHGVPLYGVNTPRKIVSAVREKGFDGLSEEERRHVPETILADDPDHMILFKSFFDEDSGIHFHQDESAWQRMLAAQCTWDATMAFNSVQILKQSSNHPIMVVLVGSGHVAYGLGIKRQAASFFSGEIKTFVPVEMMTEEEAPLTEVSAGLADYVMGLPPEYYPLYPVTGLSTKEHPEGRKVIFIEEESVASRSELQVGDLLVKFDGRPLTKEVLINELMADKRWGDTIVFSLKRGAQEKDVTLLLQRNLPEVLAPKTDAATGTTQPETITP
jgi:uncharacterized iron-regulated protein